MNTPTAIALLSFMFFSGRAMTFAEDTCQVKRGGVTVACPGGWRILDENEREVVIANFGAGPGVTKDTRSGPGRATIAVSTMPKQYRKFSEWIFAAHKVAPDAVEEKLEIAGKGGRKVRVIRMVPSDGATKGPAYSSYFVEMKEPLLIELSFRLDDPKRMEYDTSARALIEGLAF
ncbi:MAG: hypothetical protein K2X03_04040 [Bryobacteraceae bacterium]|nr:hypothetical protein [Bryobacteraceae bacterium]